LAAENFDLEAIQPSGQKLNNHRLKAGGLK
jgi:hypothetical protein